MKTQVLFAPWGWYCDSNASLTCPTHPYPAHLPRFGILGSSEQMCSEFRRGHTETRIYHQRVFLKRSFVLVFGASQAWLSWNHVSHTLTMQLSVFSYLIRSGIYSKWAPQLLLSHGAGQRNVVTLLEHGLTRASAYLVFADAMDQQRVLHSGCVISGVRTPPVRRNSKLASLGRIFKPWKWRKKKNEKLKPQPRECYFRSAPKGDGICKLTECSTRFCF